MRPALIITLALLLAGCVPPEHAAKCDPLLKKASSAENAADSKQWMDAYQMCMNAGRQ